MRNGTIHSIALLDTIINLEGSICHRRDGIFHRDGGPAIIHPNGYRAWYQYDQLHRADGPAIITKNGDQYWYQNDRSHRTDGPAAISFNGHEEFWIDGIELTKTQFEERMNR